MWSCSSKIRTMFLVIRCNGCLHMMVAPDHQAYALCPVCGVTTAIPDTRVYVNCQDKRTAEDIAHQLSQILKKRKGRDLNDEELLMLRQRFEAWERQNHYSNEYSEK